MRRGDSVKVRAYGGSILERVVLEVHPSYVLVCRLEVYREVERQAGLPAAAMGFPVEDIVSEQGDKLVAVQPD